MLTIKPDKRVYEVGEQIKLTATFENRSDKEQIIFWSDEPPRVGVAGGNHISTFPDHYNFPRVLFVPNNADKSKPIYIKFGASVKNVVVFNINDLGEYPVMMKYEFSGVLNFQTTLQQQLCLGPIISNTIIIEVVEKKGISKEDALKIAEQVCKESGWAWKDVSIQEGSEAWKITTNSKADGMNAFITVDKKSGRVLHKSFGPM